MTHPDQIAATCFDGQYHKNSVPAHMLSCMSAADPKIGSKPSVVSLWDGSHLANLADSDARMRPGCEWVQETKDAVTRITKRHVTGKGLEVLLETAANRGDVALRPKLWSDTRFAPYAARTFSVFQHNMTAMTDVLRRRVQSGEADSTERKDLKLLEGGWHCLSPNLIFVFPQCFGLKYLLRHSISFYGFAAVMSCLGPRVPLF